MPIHVPKPGDGKAFTPCPAGTYSAVCVDVVDLGELPTGFKNDDGSERVAHKVRIVWQVSKKMENGKPFIVDNRYTLSFNEYQGKKSNLLALVQAWGVNVMDLVDETNGYDVERLIGRTCLLNVVHARGVKDPTKTYANIASIMPLPEEFTPVKAQDYVRVVNREQKQQPAHDKYAFPEDNEGLPYDGTPPPDDDRLPF